MYDSIDKKTAGNFFRFTRSSRVHTSALLFFVFSVVLFCSPAMGSLFGTAAFAAQEPDSTTQQNYAGYVSGDVSENDVGNIVSGVSDSITGSSASDYAGQGASDADSTFTIFSAEDFLRLQELCQDASWSVGRTVVLSADIDLTGKTLSPVPCFCGTFQGNQHTISGVNISYDESRAGLFAALTVDAVITELRVTGTVSSKGDGIVGGIAGENSGTIRNCIFEGTVTAPYSAGGIAGINFESGTICDSKVSGTVTGKLCAGGITADNKGKVSSCENYASVSNGVSRLMAFLDNSLLKGGICGTSSGTVDNCVDRSSSVPAKTKSDAQSVFGSKSFISIATDESNDNNLLITVDKGALLLICCALLALNFISAIIVLIACKGRRY